MVKRRGRTKAPRPKSRRKAPKVRTPAITALVTRRELATRLNVHMQTVTVWERAGLPIAQRGRRGKPSRYNEAAARAWLKAREQAAAAPGPATDLVRERAEKERWQGSLAKQQYLVRQRDLIPAGEVEQAWAAQVGAARTVLLNSYTAAADRVFRVATLEGLAGVERELKDIAHAALRELAEGPAPTPATPSPAPSAPEPSAPSAAGDPAA